MPPRYLLRQAFEEAVHSHTFLYVVDSLALDEREVFNMYREVPSIMRKDEFEMKLTAEVLDPKFSTETFEGAQSLLRNLIGYYLIMEGIFFYTGFVMVLSFHRRNLMTGIGEQFQYILRDETIHLNFGIDLINGIKEENPELWTPHFQTEIIALVAQAAELEIAYSADCLPTGIFGPQRRFISRLRSLYRRQAPGTHRPPGAIRRVESIPVDERNHGPEQGEEFLRDAGDGIPIRLGAQMG